MEELGFDLWSLSDIALELLRLDYSADPLPVVTPLSEAVFSRFVSMMLSRF